MTIVSTDMRVTQQSARMLYFAPTSSNPNTNVQDAIAAAGGSSTSRTVTAAGNVTVASSDRTIVVKKTTPATTNVLLPDVTSWNGADLTIKDGGNNASTYPINVVPFGSTQTIDGYNASQLAGGYFQIGGDGGSLTLRPLADKSGWVTV